MTTTPFRKTLAAALVAGLSFAAVPAFAEASLDDATRAKIEAAMTAQGYDVRKVDVEDGMFEVYAIKDGKKLELYLDEALTIVETKDAD